MSDLELALAALTDQSDFDRARFQTVAISVRGDRSEYRLVVAGCTSAASLRLLKPLRLLPKLLVIAQTPQPICSGSSAMIPSAISGNSRQS